MAHGPESLVQEPPHLRADQNPLPPLAVPDGRPLHLARVGAGASRPPVGELGLITRSLALRAGAEIGVLAALNPAARCVEVLCSWGASPGPNDLPPLPADGFVGRVLEFGRVAVEPLDVGDASFGPAASGARLTHAVGVAVRPPGGPPGALCLGFASPPPAILG